MKDLGRVVARGIANQEPLPAPYRSWQERGMLIYRGSVTMVAGKPASYKSMLVANAVINMGRPTLFFSNDTDALTVAARLLGIATGQKTSECRAWALRDPQGVQQYLARYRHIKWEFAPDPSLTDVWLNTYAWAERYGEWPEVIVVDITSNVGIDHVNYDEWGVLRELMRQCNVLARETGSAVILVHHASEGAKTSDGHPCPGRAEVMGRVATLPVLMVTVGKKTDGSLHAACVKARNAPCDESGSTSFPMHVDPETGRVDDYSAHHMRPAYANPYAGSWGGWEED